MFNLENKITWKELAPSLQAMFKTLQSQITDVKNEVNNINISLGDINDHLTKIDNDITNINENMTTIIRDTVEDMAGEMMFLNLAPKIGYYQEDKIEVISKYNMNNMISYYIITHNNKNEEVLYFVGNDGSYARSKENKIYKATRQNIETQFVFQNTEVDIPGLTDKYVMFSFLGCGDKYICILAATKFNSDDISENDILLIKTYGFDTPSDWDIIDLDFICQHIKNQFDYDTLNNAIGASYLKYFYNFDKDILVIIGYRTWSYANSSNDKNGNNMGIFSFKVSSQQFLYFHSLGSIFDYITAANGYSFDPNIENHDIRINNLNYDNEGWEPYRWYYFPEQGLLRMAVYEKTINGYKVGSKNKIYQNKFITLMFGVPVSIWNGGTGTITKYSKKEFGLGINFDNNNIYGIGFGTNIGVNMCLYRNTNIPCRNESSGNTYFCGFVSPNDIQNDQRYRSVTIIMKGSEQNTDSRGPLYYCGKFTYFPGCVTYPPDASIYGKAFYYANGFNNKLYITASYKNTDSRTNTNIIIRQSIMLGNQFLFKGTNDEGFKIINFKPGTYESNTVAIGSINLTKLIPNMYFNNNSAFGSTIESNPQYIYSNVCDASGNTLNFTASRITYVDFDTGFKSSAYPIASVTLPSTIFDTNYGNMIRIGSRYNPLGNYYLLFLQNRDWNTTAYRGRVYFIVVETNGTVHKFGENFLSSYSSSFRNKIESIRTSNDKVELSAYSYVCISSRKMYIDFYINNTSLNNNYTRMNIMIEFSQDFNNFTMTDCSYANNMHDQGSITMIYTGDTMGLVAAERKWKNYPILIYTQKPLPGDSGTNYSTDDFMINFKANKYSMYLESSEGLVAYIPSIPIFLGGYFSIIENPIPVTLKPNSDNYIYIERDSNDRTSIIASSSTTRTINEGDKVFNKILCAKVTTDSANMISVEYYRINTGYNDYSFN